MDSDDVTRHTQTRERRDEVVQGMSRRRARDEKNVFDDGEVDVRHADQAGPSTLRSGLDPEAEAEKGNGERMRGGTGVATEEDDPNAGQYVNYQIGFEYPRKESTARKGWGLHVLVSIPYST